MKDKLSRLEKFITDNWHDTVEEENEQLTGMIAYIRDNLLDVEKVSLNVGHDIRGEIFSSPAFALYYIAEYIEILENVELSKLTEQLEKERRVRKYLRKKHDRYKKALQEAEGCTDVPASVIIRKALEEKE